MNRNSLPPKTHSALPSKLSSTDNFLQVCQGGNPQMEMQMLFFSFVAFFDAAKILLLLLLLLCCCRCCCAFLGGLSFQLFECQQTLQWLIPLGTGEGGW